jgi:predicted TIM-barrel fold metal-dependent hydrolase
VPRIFGSHKSIRCDYPIEEFRCDTGSCDVVKSVYVQTNWPAGQSLEEAEWVQAVCDGTGWPYANVVHANLADPECGELIKRLGQLKATRGDSAADPLAPRPAISFCAASGHDERSKLAPRPEASGGAQPAVRNPVVLRPDAAWRGAGAELSGHRVKHAGTLEDMSETGWNSWRDGMQALAAEPNMNVKPSGLGTFVHSRRAEVMGPIVGETVKVFGANRCLYGQQLSDRKTLDRLSQPVPDFRAAIDHLGESDQRAILCDTGGETLLNLKATRTTAEETSGEICISQCMILAPGDVITTGTLPGVGLGMSADIPESRRFGRAGNREPGRKAPDRGGGVRDCSSVIARLDRAISLPEP